MDSSGGVPRRAGWEAVQELAGLFGAQNCGSVLNQWPSLWAVSPQGIPKSLPDDVLKVRVHVGMRAQPNAKEKARRSGAPVPLLALCFLARTRPPAIHAAQHERAGRVKLRRKRGRLYRRLPLT